MPTVTTFNTQERYIRIYIYVTGKDGKKDHFRALVDTGAPRTEFSDTALVHTGLMPATKQGVALKPGLQTQKYADIILPEVEICGQTIRNLPVYVSRFEESWALDALVGLDFFRRFRVTIDYKAGQITLEPLS